VDGDLPTKAISDEALLFIPHMNTLAEKSARLDECLRELGSVLIAYSGGVDSAFLAWRASRLPEVRMLAVLADSPSLARAHFDDAVQFANGQGIPLEIIGTDEMENAEYVQNDLKRCFHCKSELFTKMEETRIRLGFQHLAYGMNLDDRGDFRPGQQAALDHGVVAPLVDAGLTKADIRALAHEANLPVWDKPASACLSSRIAYGNPVTRETLLRIEQAEAYLRERGFRQFRVRDHAGLARVEVAADELDGALSSGFVREMAAALQKLGFTYVTLDCAGYRSGSLNAEISHAPRLS